MLDVPQQSVVNLTALLTSITSVVAIVRDLDLIGASDKRISKTYSKPQCVKLIYSIFGLFLYESIEFLLD
jgi:hypothetical protein